MKEETPANAPQFKTAKGKVIVAGKPAEELFRMYDTGKMQLPSSFRRLTVYAHLERAGLLHPETKLPCYQSIFDEAMCYARTDKGEVIDEDFVWAVVRGQRAATWMTEQNILCKTKLRLLTYILKAHNTSLFTTVERAGLKSDDPIGIAKLMATAREVLHIPDTAGEPFVTPENRAETRRDIVEAVAYIVAFNLVVEFLAVALKIPEVMLYQVDLAPVIDGLAKVGSLENLFKKLRLKDTFLEVDEKLPEQLKKRIKVPTTAEIRRQIKDCWAFDGSLVFSATATLLKAACDDMTKGDDD